MNERQIERLLAGIERIAAALERANDLDPIAAIEQALTAQPETAAERQDDDSAEAWRFR